MKTTKQIQFHPGDVVELKNPMLPRVTIKYVSRRGALVGSYNGAQFRIPRRQIAAVVGHYC